MIKLVDILFLGGICFAFLEQSVSQPPPPPPPSLSNSFSAKITPVGTGYGTGIPGLDIAGETNVYINQKLKKQMLISNLGLTGDLGKMYELDDELTGKKNRSLEPFALCTVQSFEDRLISMWYWLPNATWAHTVEFRGKTVNVWLFMNKADGVYIEAGFLDTADNTPVYLISNSTQLILFEDYKEGAPPESMFVMPPKACEASFHMSALQPPPPPPPRLSNSFSSKVTLLYPGAEDKFELFVNYDFKKSLKIRELNFGSNGMVKYYELVDGNNDKAYNYLREPFDWCNDFPRGETVTPMWSWVLNATYVEGVFEFKGKLLGVWTRQDPASGDITEAGFLAPDFKTPVYKLDSDGFERSEGIMIFEHYDDATPPPETFDIPEICKTTHDSGQFL